MKLTLDEVITFSNYYYEIEGEEIDSTGLSEKFEKLKKGEDFELALKLEGLTVKFSAEETIEAQKKNPNILGVFRKYQGPSENGKVQTLGLFKKIQMYDSEDKEIHGFSNYEFDLNYFLISGDFYVSINAMEYNDDNCYEEYNVDRNVIEERFKVSHGVIMDILEKDEKTKLKILLANK